MINIDCSSLICSVVVISANVKVASRGGDRAHSMRNSTLIIILEAHAHSERSHALGQDILKN